MTQALQIALWYPNATFQTPDGPAKLVAWETYPTHTALTLSGPEWWARDSKVNTCRRRFSADEVKPILLPFAALCQPLLVDGEEVVPAIKAVQMIGWPHCDFANATAEMRECEEWCFVEAPDPTHPGDPLVVCIGADFRFEGEYGDAVTVPPAVYDALRRWHFAVGLPSGSYVTAGEGVANG